MKAPKFSGRVTNAKTQTNHLLVIIDYLKIVVRSFDLHPDGTDDVLSRIESCAVVLAGIVRELEKQDRLRKQAMKEQQ